LDITFGEIPGLIVVLVVAGAIGYLLGRHCSQGLLGFTLAVLWLPLLPAVAHPTVRATVFGAILISFVPIVIAFTFGRARRPPAANQ
jgi:hypothetical protein